jgi:PhnB protein
MAQVKPVPDCPGTIVPHLALRGAAEAIEFYKKAFGAVELMRMPTPMGLLGHAHLKIGDSHLFLADEFPGMGSCQAPATLGGTTVSLHLNVEDIDAAFQKAVAAGAKAIMPPMDMFWGDRFGKVYDPFGHEWSMATHKEDLSPEEMKKRGEAAFAQMGQGKK